MDGDVPEIRIVDGQLVTPPGTEVAVAWLPQNGQVIAKLPPTRGNRRWLHESVQIRSPKLEGDRWTLPRNCLIRLVVGAVDRFGFMVVFRDMSKLTTCTKKCLNAEGPDCDCSCLGAHHGENSFGWFERVGDVMVADRGEFTRSAVVYGATSTAASAVIYNGELSGHLYTADRAGRKGWPTASRFMCSGCVSVRARVWDHCHTHGYVRAPLCNACNTRHWSGWHPDHGRPMVSSNLDSSYYRWCHGYGDRWEPCSI